MKKKDIVILAFSIAIIGVAVFFMLRMLFPPQNNSAIVEEAATIPVVPSTIDESTYKGVENLSDYGDVSLDGIGKKDLFAGF